MFDRLTYANFGVLLAYMDNQYRMQKRLALIKEIKEEFDERTIVSLLDTYLTLHEMKHFHGEIHLIDTYRITSSGELIRAQQDIKCRIRQYISRLVQLEPTISHFDVLMRYYSRTLGGKDSPYFQEKAGLRL